MIVDVKKLSCGRTHRPPSLPLAMIVVTLLLDAALARDHAFCRILSNMMTKVW
jgi:hypothetical protein